jgi:uncharacterized protein (DUF305 family)
MTFSPALLSGLALTLTACPVLSNSPIVQPGAPGELPRELSAEEAIEVADTRYTASDAQFMRDMIPHHQQALEMSRLATNRTNSPELLEIAGKIEAAQGDEIAFMEQWLTSRGESVDRSHAHGAHHTMKGMATDAQMAALGAASGVAFDRQFLSLMIAHHEGAVDMVEALMEQPGSAYDPTLFEFTTDVTNDQSKEIELMHGLLLSLSDDPRAQLAAGLYDAEEALWNLRKVAVLTKPPGFYDPANPAELPPERFLPTEVKTGADEAVAGEQEPHAHHHGEEHVNAADDVITEATAEAEEEASEGDETEADETPDPRSPQLS